MEYDYLSSMKSDVLEYFQDHGWDSSTMSERFTDEDEAVEYFHDELWAYDPVTGNGSGSYTFNSGKAEEYLVGNLSLLKEAMEELGDKDFLWKNLDNPEALDVTIRCYLLHQAITEVIEEEEYFL